MEKEILEILKSMQSDIKKMDTRFSNLEEGQKEIKKELSVISINLDGVVDQTAELTEFKTTVLESLEDLKAVEEVTKANCYEIAKLKVVK